MNSIRLRMIALRSAMQQMLRMPLSSLLNTIVIGIAASFPLGLYTLLFNVDSLLGQLPQQYEITIFLRTSATPVDIKQVQTLLRNQPDLAQASLITRDQALQTMKSGTLGAMIDALPENPLPDAFNLTPSTSDPERLQKLVTTIGNWPQVESIQHDSDWAKRLAALLDFGRQLTVLLAAALGTALLVIASNAIRMQVLTRNDEIEVSKLIGATNTFIRRPFAYFGLLQGACGGLLAIGCVVLAMHLISPNVNQVASLYAASFALRLPEPLILLAAIAITSLLCWIGALLAVNRHLRQLDHQQG